MIRQSKKQIGLIEFLILPLLLLALILIKIGKIPLFLVKSLQFSGNRLQTIKITLPEVKLPEVKFPEIRFPKIQLPAIQFPKPQPKAPGRPDHRKPLFAFLNNINLRLVLILFMIFIFSYTYFLLKMAALIPSPRILNEGPRPLTTQILDRNGNLLYQFYEGQNRSPIDIHTLPAFVIQATIAIEDKNFYKHLGFDPAGIARATKAYFFENRVEGGSTITQQLIKNTLLTPEQSFSRKLKEIILAFWTERLYSKEEILQMYLNGSPYGGPAWGIEAAAETYFGKKAVDLNLAEAAFLAGLPASPTNYSPYGINPEKGKERQLAVLRRMVEDKYITESQAKQAENQKLEFSPTNGDIQAPHFVMYVRSLLASKYGQKVVSQGGLKVTTTLDLNIQQMAEEVVNDNLAKLTTLRVGNGAAMIMDAKSGQILAMVGSKDYFEKDSGNYNVALAIRQPGSSIKPVTYATGFKLGYSPGNLLLDAPTTFPQGTGKPYKPLNYDNKFHGPVTIRTALGSSYNIPAVKMLSLVTIPEMIKTAKELGITTFDNPDNYGLSLTLGGGGVRMIDMMTVYGTFANQGMKNQAQAILSVSDYYGNILEDHRNDTGKRAISAEIAYLINNILSDNRARTPAFGPSSLLEIPGFIVAAKTGTSDDKRDNWCFGYTPEIVVGAWVGNNDNSPMDPALSSGITGATPIWHDLMAKILEGRENLAFRRPEGIIETIVDNNHDLAIIGLQQKSTVALRKVKKVNTENGQEEETSNFSDQFSTYNPSQQTQSL